MINIQNFDPNLLRIDKISFKSNDSVICDIECITMKALIMQILVLLILITSMYPLKKIMKINENENYTEL